MFTVHTKNRAPETGFSDEPASSHKTEDAAIEAAKALASDASSYGRTVLIVEAGTNTTWSVEYVTGEASVGYQDGEPYLIPAADQHFVVTKDAREVPVTVRQEDNDAGGVAIFLDQPKGEPLEGEFTQTIHEIEVTR